MRSTAHCSPPCREPITTSAAAADPVACVPVCGCITASASAALREDLLDGPAELVRRERLEEYRAETHTIGLVDDLGRAMPGDQHHGHAGMESSSLREDFEASHAGHLVVEDHQIERLLAHELDGGLASVGALDRVAQGLEHVHTEHDDGTGVVDDEDLFLGRRHFEGAIAGTSGAPLVSVS